MEKKKKKDETPSPKKRTRRASKKENIINVVMETNAGNIEIALYPDKAPITVENFMNYVNDGFYDGLIFHRVIKGFMIQGGGFDDSLNHKTGKTPIKIESDNGLTNDRGTIAMARTSDPNSATSQFFINLADNNFLNFRAPTMQGYGYAVFGKVTKGMEVVDAIGDVPTGYGGPFQSDLPMNLIQIISVKKI